LIANARVIKLYHDLKLKGQIGIVLNVNPAAPWDEKKVADQKSADFQDVLINGLFLDHFTKANIQK